MSQNMMVSCRRSAEGAVEVVGVVLRVVVDGADATFSVPMRVPHLLQKLFSAGTAWPQFGQVRGRAMPHLPQKLLPSGASTLQPGHCKGPHLLAYLVSITAYPKRKEDGAGRRMDTAGEDGGQSDLAKAPRM
jgi:hypothetical protein